jgi:hypothetical protein
MATSLNSHDLDILEARGITLERTGTRLGIDLTLTTQGLACLANYLYLSRQAGLFLSASLLKSLVPYKPSSVSWRDLKIQAMPIHVNGGTLYRQFVWYLDANPPKLFTSLGVTHAYVPGILDVPPDVPSFKVRHGSSCRIRFADDEVRTLREDGCLAITCPDTGATSWGGSVSDLRAPGM